MLRHRADGDASVPKFISSQGQVPGSAACRRTRVKQTGHAWARYGLTNWKASWGFMERPNSLWTTSGTNPVFWGFWFIVKSSTPRCELHRSVRTLLHVEDLMV